MKTILLTAFVLLFGISNAQTINKMKLNAGIITEKLSETKKFYKEVLDFGVSFENEFYILYQRCFRTHRKRCRATGISHIRRAS